MTFLSLPLAFLLGWFLNSHLNSDLHLRLITSREKFFNIIDSVSDKDTYNNIIFKELTKVLSTEIDFIELLLKVSEEKAYNFYNKDVSTLGKQNSDLRSWLREAKQITKKHRWLKRKPNSK
jgi:hypothetical protein